MPAHLPPPHAGFGKTRPVYAPEHATDHSYAILPSWAPPQGAKGKAFVDFQNDVTIKDVKIAHQEGYRSVEHLKRYTTLGMGTDQGKTSNINALALMAEYRGITIPEAGTTTFRPPYAPLTMGAIAGRTVGSHFRPVRRSPLHDWHVKNGATFIDAGLWKRAWFYAWAGATPETAYVKEMELVRRGVGLADVSTLGKIDIQGPDAAEFLNRVYVNGFAKLPVGKVRYGVMLNDDGIVLDDGTTARISENQFYMTTTTAQAGEVMSWLEYLLQMPLAGAQRAGGLAHRRVGRHGRLGPQGARGAAAGLPRRGRLRRRPALHGLQGHRVRRRHRAAAAHVLLGRARLRGPCGGGLSPSACGSTS